MTNCLCKRVVGVCDTAVRFYSNRMRITLPLTLGRGMGVRRFRGCTIHARSTLPIVLVLEITE